MNDDVTREGREIADLLPFYANGTLPAQERARVAMALTSEPALRHELALIEEELQETISANEALGAPSRQARDRFFTMLNAQPQATAAGRRVDPLAWVAAQLSALRPRTLAWSAALALVVLAVQSGTLGLIATRGLTEKPGFQTASVSAPATSGPKIIIAFTPGATIADITNLLANIDATIVAGPMPGGLFEIRVGRYVANVKDTNVKDTNVKDTNAKDLDAIVAKLKASSSLVRFAAPGQAGDGAD